MDRMLVVVFDNENKAYEGKEALQQLDSEGSISVYAYAVLAKNADGTATLKQGDDVGRSALCSEHPSGVSLVYLGGLQVSPSARPLGWLPVAPST